MTPKPIPRVLARRNLLFGGEREPVLLSAFLLAGVACTSMTIVAAVVCGLLWAGIIAVLRWMAKVDPQLISKYLRSLKYRGYYPAFSRPYRKL